VQFRGVKNSRRAKETHARDGKREWHTKRFLEFKKSSPLGQKSTLRKKKRNRILEAVMVANLIPIFCHN
jgi:hypothetical protein